MRSALAGSAGVHLACVAGIVFLQLRAPKLVMGPESIQVALLDMPASRVPAVAPPSEPAKAVKPPELVREEGTGVKIEPTRPKVTPKQTPPPPTTPVPPTAALALPRSPMGTAGLSGDASVDASNFEFSYYLVLVRNRIAANWSPPSGMASSGTPVRSVVYFRIERDGSLASVRMESPSAAEFFDRSSLRAVQLSDPMPPLPDGFKGGSLGVHFGFEYTAP